MKRKRDARFVGLSEAAQILGCSVTHFHQIVVPQGKIRSFRLVGGQQRRYVREDCEKLAREYGVPEDGPAADAA